MLCIMSYLWSVCDTNTSYYFNLNIYFSCFPFVWHFLEWSVKTKLAKHHVNKKGSALSSCHEFEIEIILHIKDDDQLFLSLVLSTLLALFPCALCCPTCDKDKAWRRFLEHWIRCGVYQFSPIYSPVSFPQREYLTIPWRCLNSW